MEINKELMAKHWEEMRKLYNEQVVDIRDKEPEKASANFERLANEELEWLKDHPNCYRYFSSLNTEVNPPSYVFPDATKVPCKDCIFVGKGGPTKVYCKIYRQPNMKPNNVLWGKNPKCEYRVTHKEAEKARLKIKE